MNTTDQAFPAVTIHTEGTWFECSHLDGSDRLRAMQQRCNARIIEKITAGAFDLWVDEEGIHNGQPLNVTASAMAHVLTGRAFKLFGPVLITRAPRDGEDSAQPLTGGDVERLLTLHRLLTVDTPDEID